MKLFKQPKWIRPELNDIKYYVHLLVISAVVLGLLELFVSKGRFSILNILISSAFILVGDVVAHTILGLD